MQLSKAQKQRLKRLLNDDWQSEDELEALIAEVEAPEELHLFADGFNWDCGSSEMLKVIRHPLCDRGTALLVYWHASPGYYLRYVDRAKVDEHELEDYDLVKEIERKFANGDFRTSRIPFNPRNHEGTDLTPKKAEIKRAGRDLPSIMYEAII